MNNTKKGQIFSMDTIIGIVIFLVVFTIFFGMIAQNTQKSTVEDLNDEAEILANQLADDEEAVAALEDLSIVEDGNLNDEKLTELVTTKDYEDIKKELGIQGDFCIFFEDEQGNVINLSDITGVETLGYGDGSINVSGIECQMQ